MSVRLLFVFRVLGSRILCDMTASLRPRLCYLVLALKISQLPRPCVSLELSASCLALSLKKLPCVHHCYYHFVIIIIYYFYFLTRIHSVVCGICPISAVCMVLLSRQ